MTRFARAKGSKSSNERAPESATSWQEMRQNIVNSKTNENIESPKYSANTSENVVNQKETNVRWSEFPNMTEAKNPKNKKKNNHSTENNMKVNLKHKNRNEIDEKPFKKIKSSKKIEKSHDSTPKDISRMNYDKKGKGKDNLKEYKRRKPDKVDKMFINGNEVEIAYIEGFPVKKADAERLKQLKKDMISRGLPRSEIAKALKLERRRAEKALSREKKKVCFNCRQSGHTLSECTQLRDESNVEQFGTGICFKCGSTEHTHFECKVQRGDHFKFAQCFICKEQGHIARQCPDNDRGMYPKGGACKVCGDVTHLKKDCPKYQFEQEQQTMIVDTINDQNIESLGNETTKVNKKSQRSQKIIKF